MYTVREVTRYRSGDPTILLTASEARMPDDGSVKLRAKANGINVSIDALVSNAIQDEMLVSYKDLMALQIIPGGFPSTIIQKCREVTRIEPKEILLEEYPDVLRDKLSPLPCTYTSRREPRQER